MIINVGSKNDVKVNAVKETIRNYKFLEKSEVNGIEVPSGVSEQPKSMQEIIQGGMNRAKNAFKDCNLSFG
jgi:non-canonical (house-cleaning) NTP pyrophosphatase